MEDKEQTEELRAAQLERQKTEEHLALSAQDEDEAAQHQRRAEKSRYLREKLEERAASEQDTD
jgi:hypothetical protein